MLSLSFVHSCNSFESGFTNSDLRLQDLLRTIKAAKIRLNYARAYSTIKNRPFIQCFHISKRLAKRV